GLRRTRPERRVQQKHRAGRTARSLQYRSPEGGAAAGRVTFAKDFLKVAVQKLNNSIFHSSIPCLLFGAARRQVAFTRTRLPPPYRLLAVSLRDLPDELGPGHVDRAVDREGTDRPRALHHSRGHHAVRD